MVRIENIRIYEDLEIDEIIAIACKKNKLDKSKVKKVIIHKKSVDARKKDNVFYNYSIDIDYDGKVPKNLKIVPEEDFKLRGSGDLFGTKQSGDMNFKIANLTSDYDILIKAKNDSEKILKDIDNYPLLKNILINSISKD